METVNYRPLISVVVCTYNRADLLADCLKSLENQTLGKKYFEVVVVDNNSTDNTFVVAESFSGKFPYYKIVTEKKQGLSHARNRGWQEGDGEYIAYVDDDAIAFQDWIEKMLEFSHRHPEILAFGGPYYGYSMVELPEWIPPGFGSNNLGDQERPIIMGRGWISGSNMVFSKRLLREMGGFRTDIGMTGNKISYGEETALFKKISTCGMQIYYVPSMKIKHLIPEYKMSVSWMLRSAYSTGRCSAKVFNNYRSLTFHLFAFVKALVKTLVILNPFSRIPFKRKVLFSLRPLVAAIGAMKEYWMIARGKESLKI